MKIQMVPTASLLVDGVGRGLYSNPGQCLMELNRNSGAASQVDVNTWDPKLVNIEIALISNHPLANREMALVHLDHASGLTTPNFDRYFRYLGTPLSKLRQFRNGTHGGASEKGLGRLAAFSLNGKCLDPDPLVRIQNGYYLLTRTSKSGKVRFVSVIPERMEDGGFEVDTYIDPDSTEMGNLKGIKGSFTAIVIPNPIFKSPGEIYEATKWLLPREKDKMFNLLIGGKKVEPPEPKWELNITSEDNRFRARLYRDEKCETDGVWLVDEMTSLRVASCQRLGGKVVPDPLSFPGLAGDIFAPDLLGHQNTARDSLAPGYATKSNPNWRKLWMWMVRDVAPPAKKLVERDAITGKAADVLDDLVELFKERFGEPEKKQRKPGESPTDRPDHDPKKLKPKGEGDEEEKDPYRRMIKIKVRDEEYKLYRGLSLHPYEFARVHETDSNMILVNVRGGFEALPDTKAQRQESCLFQILLAIGSSKFPSDRDAGVRFANEVRRDLLKK